VSWKTVELNEVCDFQNGFAFKSNLFTAEGLPILRISNIQNQKIDTSSLVYFNKESYKERIEQYEVKPNDLLIAMSGATTGKIGFNNTDKIFYLNQRVGNFKPRNSLDKKYLYYFLSTQVEKNLSISAGAAQPNLSTEQIKGMLIPLPLIAIQQKIVAKLDAIFAEIDTATVTAEANVNNAKQLFESYLKNVFENKSKKFESKKINEISINLDSKRVPITKDLRTNGDVPYYGASGIVDYVSDFLFEEDILLVSEDGANLLDRNYPIAFSVSGKSWVNNHAHVLKFENMISQKFVEFYLNSISLKPYVSGMAQPKLNQGMLNKIPIPFPNITIQKDLVNDFETMKENRNILLNSYVKKNSELALLKNSILQKAFSGELVKD
jgi:type I restriction enzyme S subunit